MSHASLHTDAVALLNSWAPLDPQQDALRHAFLAFLAARADGTQRDCEPGHLTASAVVLDPERRNVLMTLHPRVGAWVQLGGHCEAGDDTLADAALREATEESGLSALRLVGLVHLDVHPITCSLGKPTRHFDARFLLTSEADAVPQRSAESDDLRFWSVDDLPANADASVRAAVAAAIRYEDQVAEGGLGGRQLRA
jgi:8-oxo-dGTP pyrophosphatase MutT (NUDIX family)